MKITYIPRTIDLYEKKLQLTRVSTLLEEQKDSFDFQQDYYSRFIIAHEDLEFAGIYSDEDSETKANNRPRFQELIEDALAGKNDFILYKFVSRFSRNVVDCKKYVQLLKGNRVRVYFEKENVNTAELSSSMIFSFLSAVSQDDSRRISDNVK